MTKILTKIVKNFLSEFNRDYRLVNLDGEEAVRHSYSPDFFRNLHVHKMIPRFAYCVWFSYLLKKHLDGAGILSRIVLQKMIVDGVVCIHFYLQVSFLKELYYLDLVGTSLYLTRTEESVRLLEKEKGSKLTSVAKVVFDHNAVSPDDMDVILKNPLLHD